MEVQNLLLDEVFKLNDRNLKKLKSRLRENQYTFCLGAGVSISAGLPDWYTLLARILGRLLYLSNNKYLDSRDNAGSYSAYHEAKYEIFKQFAANAEFQEKLKDSYAGKYRYMLAGEDTLELAEAVYELIFKITTASRINMGAVDGLTGDGQNWKELTDFYLKQLVKEICRPKKKIEDMVEDVLGVIVKILVEVEPCGKREIITYNYDNLLEEGLRTLGKVADTEICSFGSSKTVKPKEKKGQYLIYHVHGFLPVTDNPEDAASESERIVLTENSYDDIGKMGYDWVNVIQSYKYHTSNMVFIGFSGQDYNFRRILRNLSVDGEVRHYIFICIDDIVERVFKTQKDEIDARYPEDPVKASEEFGKLLNNKTGLREKYAFELVILNQMLSAKSVYWEKHGLMPVWTTISQLPKALGKLIER